MFNRELKKKRLQKAFTEGFKKAVEEKNLFIKQLRNKHYNEIKKKNNKILKLKKQVQKIENKMEDYSGIFKDLKFAVEMISSNSYIKTMSQHNEHQKIISVQDNIERLSRQFSKADLEVTSKVLEFKKVQNG